MQTDPTRAAIAAILNRFRTCPRTRILAFGSSNTERFLPGMHWFDCLDLAIRQRYGRVHTCINTGVGGDTAAKLLARFDDDAAHYRPHLAFVTVGGNDSFPKNGVTPDAFRSNLTELQRRFAAIETAVLFQTYYAPDPDLHGDVTTFHAYMQIVREVARDTRAGLIDHLARWEPLRKARPDLYKPLMQDAFHLNARGNAVVGVDLARAFEAELGVGDAGAWAEALTVQRAMDALAATPKAD